MNARYSKWAEVPMGLCLVRMFHERLGKHCLHLHMKLDDGAPWYDQPRVPVYSEEATKNHHREFWTWAEQNLPIWDYPEVVKNHA